LEELLDSATSISKDDPTVEPNQKYNEPRLLKLA
jgi:hypothetical protein